MGTKTIWIGGVVLLCMIAILCTWALFSVNDGLDQRALLIGIDDRGVVTLDASGSPVVGPLSDITKTPMDIQSPNAQAVLQVARRDTVAYQIDPRGSIKVWFMTGSGLQSLGEELSSSRQ